MRMPAVTSNILRRAANSNNTAQPYIASVSGGLSDFTLLTLLTLHKRGVPAILYEREVSFAARGFFDFGRDTGLRGL